MLGADTRKAMVFSNGTCGAMDNASDYGSEDSRFESWQVRFFLNAMVSFWPVSFTLNRSNAKNLKNRDDSTSDGAKRLGFESRFGQVNLAFWRPNV